MQKSELHRITGAHSERPKWKVLSAMGLLWCAACSSLGSSAGTEVDGVTVESLVERSEPVEVDVVEPHDSSEPELAIQLEPLLQFLRNGADAKVDRQLWLEWLASDEPALKAVATLGLYRLDPDIYWSQMIDCFGAHDYLARSFGRKIHTTQKRCARVVAEIAADYGGEDKGAILLLAFLHYQNSNEWVQAGRSLRSVARYYRKAFLETVLGGHEASALSHRIDQAAILRERASGYR